MSDHDWFAPKRYGYGASLPIAWQGWALTLGFVTVAIFLADVFRGNRLQLLGALAPLGIVFMIVCARTTRGGWRWRWGEKDQ